MKTWQDFEQATDRIDFIRQALGEYMGSKEYKIALDADQYERQQNTTIRQYIKYIYMQTGARVEDITASNNRIASNFFHRLNTQRCAYSLGNGVSFQTTKEVRDDDGDEYTVDLTKERLGSKFDTVLYNAGYDALIHGVSYIFWNYDQAYEFKMTEFCPLLDEYTGALRGGMRFWSLDWNKKPVTVVLYTEDGYTKYRTKKDASGLELEEYEPQKPYKQQVQQSAIEAETVVGESNYSSLPIVPLYGSKHKQSTLIGLKECIDAYDLIQSGFANDLEDCAEIYWLIADADGMKPRDIQRFREEVKFHHVAISDSENPVTPYTQEIPTTAREAFLQSIRAQMYEDFGALDVHTVAAGATNDHIDAAYQPLEENADDFEYQIIECVQQILALIGIEDTPQFKRNRISNQKEQVEMLAMVADKLDEETFLSKLPFITVDEVKKILKAKDAESDSRFDTEEEEQPEV